VRGPSVMRGYFRDPEATRAAIRDGWFHTGDLGRFDRDGQLAITGRLKDLIVTAAGKNVSPIEAEARYAGIPGVKELCISGARGARARAVRTPASGRRRTATSRRACSRRSRR